MNFEYMKKNDVPQFLLSHRGRRKSEFTLKVEDFLSTDKEVLRIDFEDTSKVNSAYNALYARYIRRREKDSPILIDMVRKGNSLYVIKR